MKISIITATKNNKAGLLRAIECVRNQTYKNVEHIIIDGGSTDGSVEAIKNLQLTMYNSGRAGVILNEMKDLHSSIDSSPAAQNDLLPTTNYQLITISEADSGIYDAINKGIKLATGDVIGLLHSDDLYADENVISSYAKEFKRPFDSVYPEQSRRTQGDTIPRAQGDRVDAVYSDLVYVSQKSGFRNYRPPTTDNQLPTSNSVLRYWKTQDKEFTTETQKHKAILNGWMPPHPTLFIRREIFEKYGLYNTDLKIASDYEMILRLFYKHKINSCYLPLTTYLMSTGGASNKSINNIKQKSKEDYLAMKMYNIPWPLFTLISKNLRKIPQFLARGL